MDLVAAYHHATDNVLLMAGCTDKEAHFNIGLMIYVAVQYGLRTRRASLAALIAVAVCEGGNEILDFLFFGSWRWEDTLGDIAATLTWPVILYVLSRHRRRRWTRDAAASASASRRTRSRGPSPVPAAV